MKKHNDYISVPNWLLRIGMVAHPNFVIKQIGVILRFADVQEALSRPDIFQVTYATSMDPSVGPFMLGRDNTIYNQRDKGIMLAVLNQTEIPRIQKLIREILQEIVSNLQHTKTINIVDTFTRRCPALFVMRYFGFENTTVEKIEKWSYSTQLDMFHNFDNNETVRSNNIAAGREMLAFLKELLPIKNAELQNGKPPETVFEKLLFMSDKLAVTGFDEARILTNTMGLLVGAIETTSQAIAQIINQLLNRQEVMKGIIQAASKNDDDLLWKYCREALRFHPITPGVFRECKEDYVIASGTVRRKKFKVGTKMFISTQSAMQDRRALSNPSKFRLDRPDYHYMHFGYGAHECLGTEISRILIPEIVKSIVLLPEITRASELEYADGVFPSCLEINQSI